MIKACTCKHAFQDAKYGKGMRVHNEDKKGVPHCTVCGPNPITRKMAAIIRGWLPFHSGTPKNDGTIKPILPN